MCPQSILRDAAFAVFFIWTVSTTMAATYLLWHAVVDGDSSTSHTHHVKDTYIFSSDALWMIMLHNLMYFSSDILLILWPKFIKTAASRKCWAHDQCTEIVQPSFSSKAAVGVMLGLSLALTRQHSQCLPVPWHKRSIQHIAQCTKHRIVMVKNDSKATDSFCCLKLCWSRDQ